MAPPGDIGSVAAHGLENEEWTDGKWGGLMAAMFDNTAVMKCEEGRWGVMPPLVTSLLA